MINEQAIAFSKRDFQKMSRDMLEAAMSGFKKLPFVHHESTTIVEDNSPVPDWPFVVTFERI